MKYMFTPEGFDTIAKCISRGEHLTVETGEITATHLWCDECQELSAVTVPVQGISSEAVYDLGTVTVCTQHKDSND